LPFRAPCAAAPPPRRAVGETVGLNFDPSHLFWTGADALAMIGHDDVLSIGYDVLALPPLEGIARSVALPRRAMTRAT
jgi:hypothetical protein